MDKARIILDYGGSFNVTCYDKEFSADFEKVSTKLNQVLHASAPCFI